ncbi:hypothetical protein [Frateuria sp. Soil773]|uniref:hypothetical protein n=1 Tax=Frateuria sp. Soil773 TaxID=1736407 RepID=UPI0012F92120|nr:hypothetical protein [Frateuria sp. Soil773]
MTVPALGQRSWTSIHDRAMAGQAGACRLSAALECRRRLIRACRTVPPGQQAMAFTKARSDPRKL